MVFIGELSKNISHFAINMLGKAKPVSTFPGPDFAGLASPVIHILEKMMMNALLMHVVEVASG
ncbi:hypothetical protein GCM10007879_06930 [Maritalea porphyrae]|uniref:Uncharacterized protein n=1 Tax=Maritalea porphyrae TaxID=880732 RepID=A0ABQ5UMI7_9HYPH|nr:hypothetical protein GCM10007879_06930 [Maritalea porphyrae]